jgi:hypothetical protein
VISIRSLQRRNECRALSLMFALAVNAGTRTTLRGRLGRSRDSSHSMISSLTQWMMEAMCVSVGLAAR